MNLVLSILGGALVFAFVGGITFVLGFLVGDAIEKGGNT